MVTLCF